MKTTMKRTFTSAFLFALVLSTCASAICYDKCRFRFCNYHESFTTGRGTPDIAFTKAICSKGSTRVGIVGETGQPYIMEGGSATPISEWDPPGLEQPFAETFFKSFIIEPEGYISGIGHETVQKNQKDYLNDRCFVVPVRQFVVLNEHNSPIDNEWPNDPLFECIAFKSYSW